MLICSCTFVFTCLINGNSVDIKCNNLYIISPVLCNLLNKPQDSDFNTESCYIIFTNRYGFWLEIKRRQLSTSVILQDILIHLWRNCGLLKVRTAQIVKLSSLHILARVYFIFLFTINIFAFDCIQLGSLVTLALLLYVTHTKAQVHFSSWKAAYQWNILICAEENYRFFFLCLTLSPFLLSLHHSHLKNFCKKKKNK